MFTKEFLSECEQFIKDGGGFIPFCLSPHKLMDIDPVGIENYIVKNRNLFFVQQLFHMIDKTGKKDSEVYKKAGMDRRLFSKIRSNKEYVPAKKTVIALCLALELSREDADALLASAGYSLSRASDFDLIVAFCIEKQMFDFANINEVLEHFGFEPF